MARVLRTTRRLPKETLTFEPFESLDGQGMPDYGTPVEFEGNVLEYDASNAEQFVVTKDGSRVRTPLTVYVEGDAPDVPNEQDRVTLSEGRTFIVAERKKVSGLTYSRSEPDHYRLRCRIEQE